MWHGYRGQEYPVAIAEKVARLINMAKLRLMNSESHVSVFHGKLNKLAKFQKGE
jgi:hypothetical protein